MPPATASHSAAAAAAVFLALLLGCCRGCLSCLCDPAQGLRTSPHPAPPHPNGCTCRRWIADELAPAAFPRLGELRPVPVDAFDQRFDVWTITAPLSEGCGGPELPREVIL